jgi:intracellular multiplication protein IcmC
MDIFTLLINLDEANGPLVRLVTSAAYLIGIFFGIRAILALRNLSGNNQGGIKTFLVYISISSAMLYLPTAIDAFVVTIFNSTISPISYTENTSSLIPASLNAIIMRLIQLIGLISFIRGWLLLGNLANSNGQPVFAKALVHVIGGVLAINVEGTKNIIYATIGF